MTSPVETAIRGIVTTGIMGVASINRSMRRAKGPNPYLTGVHTPLKDENTFTDLTQPEDDWLERFAAAPAAASEESSAAKQLVDRLLEMLSPPARLVITLLELEDRSVKEIAELTGWSVPLVKVRAFRARAEMKKCLQRITKDKYL